MLEASLAVWLGSASSPKTAPAPGFDIWQPWGSWERLLGETWRPGGRRAVLRVVAWVSNRPSPLSSHRDPEQQLRRDRAQPPLPAAPPPHLQALLCLPGQILRLPLWGQRL